MAPSSIRLALLPGRPSPCYHTKAGPVSLCLRKVPKKSVGEEPEEDEEESEGIVGCGRKGKASGQPAKDSFSVRERVRGRVD